MKKIKKTLKSLALLCVVAGSCGLSSCSALFDLYGPPPPPHYAPPPPPPHKHHRHQPPPPHRHHHCAIDTPTVNDFDIT